MDIEAEKAAFKENVARFNAIVAKRQQAPHPLRFSIGS